jgi:ABC-type polysaccharide/polyol phosphate transport system ATPase subunit
MKAPPAAIVAHDLGIKYDLGIRGRTLRRVMSRLARSSRRHPDEEPFWALKHVDFSVHEGDILGVIGHNGAGKSTLLLAIAGIIGPDLGWLETYGRRPTLLTLGAGFERELTGRENIRLNAAYLGLSRKQIDRLIDPIAEFAELEAFLDVPLKKYSTGMHARLGFSIAAHTEPDILLLDEVLSVGDISFQQKSRTRMFELMEKARAIVVVTHSLPFIADTCTKALWLDHGRVRGFGATEMVLADYQEALAEAPPPRAAAAAESR